MIHELIRWDSLQDCCNFMRIIIEKKNVEKITNFDVFVIYTLKLSKQLKVKTEKGR